MASLFVWHRSMGTINVADIQTPKAEMFYWTTIMFSQTLGTALRDRTADTAGMGYSVSAMLFGGLLVLLVMAYYWQPFGYHLMVDTSTVVIIIMSFIVTLGLAFVASFLPLQQFCSRPAIESLRGDA